MSRFFKTLITFITLVLAVGNTTAQELTLSPDVLNFRWVLVGEMEELTLTFSNTGQELLEVQRVNNRDRENFSLFCEEALEARSTILNIFVAVSQYHNDHNSDPSSVEELLERGYLIIEEEIAREWSFNLIGSNPVMMIEAVSTAQMKERGGHVVMYDVTSSQFYGFDYTGHFDLDVRETRTYTIRFSPAEVRNYEEDLIIYSNDRENDSLIVTMRGEGILSIDDDSFDRVPVEFGIVSAFPNPFNATTTITYGLPFASQVSLQLYDITGRNIKTLFEGHKQPGIYTTILTADNLPSGLYFVRLEGSGEVARTVKMTLIR